MAFASILAEARKYRLCLILAHQYIDQLSLPVRQAVFGNVGTLIAFRIGHADAEILEKELGNTFQASAIADLDRYEAVVKLLEDGTNRTPFRAKMLPPLENRIGRKKKLIARSRERFATARGIVEDKLNRWMPAFQFKSHRAQLNLFPSRFLHAAPRTPGASKPLRASTPRI